MKLFSPEIAYHYFEERLQLYRQYEYDIVGERLNFLKWIEFLPQPIVEIGTGKGYFTLCLAKMGYKVYSIDLDQEAIEFSNALLEYFGLESNVKLLRGDIDLLKEIRPLSVVSFNLWHHIKNNERFINSIIETSPQLIAMVDFSDEGFLLTDKLHRMVYGSSHLVIQPDLKKWESFLEARGYDLFYYESKFERGFCALRKKRK